MSELLANEAYQAIAYLNKRNDYDKSQLGKIEEEATIVKLSDWQARRKQYLSRSINGTENKLMALKNYIQLLEDRVAHFAPENLEALTLEFTNKENPFFDSIKAFAAFAYYVREPLLVDFRKRHYWYEKDSKKDLESIEDEKERTKATAKLAKDKAYLTERKTIIDNVIKVQEWIMSRPERQDKEKAKLVYYKSAYQKVLAECIRLKKLTIALT